MDESRGYWKDVLTILDDYSAKNYKREPTTLEMIKSINMRPSQVKRQRKLVLDEYMTLKAIDVKKVDPPPYLEGHRLRREKTLVDDPWACQDQAVRQLANISRKSPHQRYFPGFGDPRLSGARNSFGTPLRPLYREVTRLPTDIRHSKPWEKRKILPEIGTRYPEFENSHDSPIPASPLERGISLLYDVDERCTNSDDVIADETHMASSRSIENDRICLTNTSDNDQLVASNKDGGSGSMLSSDEQLPVMADSDL